MSALEAGHHRGVTALHHGEVLSQAHHLAALLRCRLDFDPEDLRGGFPGVDDEAVWVLGHAWVLGTQFHFREYLVATLMEVDQENAAQQLVFPAIGR